MSHLGFWSLALPSCILLPACWHGGSVDAVEQMHATLSEARVENQRHATACDAAPSMPVMMDELDHHEARMGHLLQQMEEARDRMKDDSVRGHCMGQGFAHMSSGLDGLGDAMAEHGSRMRAAEVVVDAHAECDLHTSAAATMMSGMMSDLESMACMGR